MAVQRHLGGSRHSSVLLTIGGDVPDEAPRVYVTSPGFWHLKTEEDLWGADATRFIKRLTGAMRDADDGLYLAFVSCDDGPHPLVLVQDDRGAFSQRHHGDAFPGKPAWRDFHFTAGHVAVDVADNLWGSNVIAVRSLSSGPALPRDALIAFLEGVGLLLDSCKLHLKRLDFSGLDGLEAELERGVKILGREQASTSPPTLRPLLQEDIDPKQLGVRARGINLRLLRVDLS